MKIKNKKKFIIRIVDLIVIVVTIVLTMKAIAYANAMRGYQAFGGEYLIPLLGLLEISLIEEWYEESSK